MHESTLVTIVAEARRGLSNLQILQQRPKFCVYAVMQTKTPFAFNTSSRNE